MLLAMVTKQVWRDSLSPVTFTFLVAASQSFFACQACLTDTVETVHPALLTDLSQVRTRATVISHDPRQAGRQTDSPYHDVAAPPQSRL